MTLVKFRNGNSLDSLFPHNNRMDFPAFFNDVFDHLLKLLVSGERKEEKVEEKDKVTKREFHYGSFKRSFTLPEIADAKKINASYNNGVLSVSIAKKEEAKQNAKRQISVE